MKRLTGTNKEIAELLYQEQLELSKENGDVESTVQAIIENVKKRGDEALRDYSAKFDKVDLTDFEVGQDLIDQAFKEIDPEVYQALVNAKENIESYHKHQLEAGFEDQPSEGVIRGQLIRPINRVGVYVPGGTAAYPSSVLMNVIPAKIAGVKEIIMITPPQEHFVPAILVAAKLAGVDSIYQVGGAQGVAAYNALKPSSNVLSSVALLLAHPEPHNTNPESPSCAARISAADHVTTEDSSLAVDALATMLLEPLTGIILTTIKAAIRTDNILLVLFLMKKASFSFS